MKNKLRNVIVFFADFILIPFTLIAAIWFKLIRLYNIGLFGTVSPFSKVIFRKVGVFPIVNHYYEPYFVTKKPKKSFRENRNLPGIDFNITQQLQTLQQFHYNDDIKAIAAQPTGLLNYSFSEGPFLSGDSEILFNMIRRYKPCKIVEIGCGHSSLMMQHAIQFNKKEDAGYTCKHICIEPYENGWISQLDVEVVLQPVEQVGMSLFHSLKKNDILFIDSSHMIRPQGDVLFEYLELLPVLKPGVLVHIHDIFSPKDYLDEWLTKGVNFWNEQYLLEAFLSCNHDYTILCAVNFLKHNYFTELSGKCPMLTSDREPGSFWITKN